MTNTLWHSITFGLLLSWAVFCFAVPRNTAAAEQNNVQHDRARMKLSVRVKAHPSEEYLLYLHQMGLSHVDVVLTSGNYDREALVKSVERFREHGFEVGSINNHIFWARKSDPILLGHDGRDALMQEYRETFVDNGYVDMHEVMKALYDVGYGGTVIPDHSPVMVGDDAFPSGGVGIGSGTGRAYTIAYMRAILMALGKGWGSDESGSSITSRDVLLSRVCSNMDQRNV